MNEFGIVRRRPRRLGAYARAVGQARIFARLRDGWAHNDIARDESLSAKRVRQIVSEALQQRPVSDGETHLRLQIERLGPALKAAGAALAKGDARAIRPLLKVVDQLDRYHEIVRARATGRADPERLVDRIARMAAPPDDAAGAEPAETAAMAEGRPPPAPEAESDGSKFFRASFAARL